MNQVCKGPDCNRTELVAKGMCAGHYYQLKRTGRLAPLLPYEKRPEAPKGYAFCKDCRSFKPVDEFYTMKATGEPRYICKECAKRRNREAARRKRETV